MVEGEGGKKRVKERRLRERRLRERREKVMVVVKMEGRGKMVREGE